MQQQETVEKSNSADIESVTIEHPKTIASLSKVIKQSKMITQKPKYKIKNHSQSKASDYK